MTTHHWTDQPNPLTLDDYLAIDEDERKDIEVVDGIVVRREQRTRGHQKTGVRLFNALEAAVVKYRREHKGANAPCFEVNTEVDVVLWEVPLTVRRPDVILHHCVDDFGQLEASDILLAVEVLSRWSEHRDRIHKMGEYARAGIPHYLIVQFDDVGVLIVEHYALVADERTYEKIAVTQRDRNAFALNITTPLKALVDWQDLEIEPDV